MPYPYKWRTKGESIDERGNPYNGVGMPYGHGKAFKYVERDLALNNRFVLKDSVFAAGFSHVGGRRLNLPHPDLIERCEGVVLAWLADGRFRADASIAAVRRKFPDCITSWRARRPATSGVKKCGTGIGGIPTSAATASRPTRARSSSRSSSKPNVAQSKHTSVIHKTRSRGQSLAPASSALTVPAAIV